MDELLGKTEGTIPSETTENMIAQNKVGNNLEMEILLKKVKRIELFTYFSFALIAILLVFSIISVNNDTTTTATSKPKPLPNNFDQTVAMNIINQIKDAYNSEDNEKLYNVMGSYAKTFVNRDDFDKQIKQIRFLGKMEKVSYTHHEYLESRDGGDFFQLNFVAKYGSGDGNATVTIKSNDKDWEVVGFRFNVANLQQIQK